MNQERYLEQLRLSLSSARIHHSMAAIARDIGISSAVLTAFSRNRGLGPSSRAALESWLCEHGYWPLANEFKPSSNLDSGFESSQARGASLDAVISGGDLPVSELVARWHEAQIAMLRSHHLTESQKKRLEGQWLKAYSQAWVELEKAD